MNNIRVISRLDIKGPNLIKGINLEGLRVIGNPRDFANHYYAQGADELIYMDTVASLYGRNSLHELIAKSALDIFIPMTVGGGIRNINDAKKIFRSGADKIALNTAAVKNPKLIKELAEKFGSQAIVLYIEAKKQKKGWEVYTDNGRERTGIDVKSWIKQGVELGAGEVLITSVDKEGTRSGFDIDLLKEITKDIYVPIIASGGLGKPEDLVNAVKDGNVQAVAIADYLHYKRGTIRDLKQTAHQNLINVRI